MRNNMTGDFQEYLSSCRTVCQLLMIVRRRRTEPLCLLSLGYASVEKTVNHIFLLGLGVGMLRKER
jgi:hypothetical protein